MHILGRIYTYIFRDIIAMIALSSNNSSFMFIFFVSFSGITHQSLLSVKDHSDIVCKEYADSLRAYYTQHELSSSKWPHAPKYINLAVINSDVHANRKELLQVQQQNHFVDDILEWKNSIAMQDILKPNSVSGHTYPVTQVLIEGAPGIGKSTFAWEMCQKWSQHQIFNEYSLVVLLKFRDKRIQEAKSVSDLFHHPNPKLQSDIVHDIELVGGHGLLLILITAKISITLQCTLMHITAYETDATEAA